jgi:zinc/manganese transport system permease protein
MLFLGIVFMLIVAIAVSFAVQVTGVLLIFSLMVTPAATAQYLSRKPSRAILISVLIAVVTTWVGLFVAFYTPYPVSFFITAIVFGLYLAVRGLRQLLKPRNSNNLSLITRAEVLPDLVMPKKTVFRKLR